MPLPPPPSSDDKKGSWFFSSQATTSFSSQDANTDNLLGRVDNGNDNDTKTAAATVSSPQQAASDTTASSSNNNVTNPSTTYTRDPIYLWSSLVAGAGSGALASVICAPLDLIRTRLQVWGELAATTTSTTTTNSAAKRGLALIPYMIHDIWVKEGIKGYFRGLGATLVTVPAFWGVYFPLYDDLKRYWASQYPHVGTAWIHMGSAVSAGVVSDIICNPMFVVRTRLQTEALHGMMDNNNTQRKSTKTYRKPKSMTQTAKALYQEGGIWIFWRGMTANLLGLSHVAVQFPVYERLKQELKRHKRENSAGDLFLASAASKMTASLLTYPHEVIRSRMMDARSTKRVGFWQTCRRIHAMEGFKGFYAGLPVTLLRVLPNTCITFMTYELLLQWAKKRIQQHRASPTASPTTNTSSLLGNKR